MRALSNYLASRAMRIQDATAFKTTRVPMGLGMSEEINPLEMAVLKRAVVHGSDRHLGFLSFSQDDQNLLKRALDLALTATLPDQAYAMFEDYEIHLTAGSPYDGSRAHLSVEARGISSLMHSYSPEDFRAAIKGVEEALAELLDHIEPQAMYHSRADIKASWTVCEARPVAGSNHDRLAACGALKALVREAIDAR